MSRLTVGVDTLTPPDILWRSNGPGVVKHASARKLATILNLCIASLSSAGFQREWRQCRHLVTAGYNCAGDHLSREYPAAGVRSPSVCVEGWGNIPRKYMRGARPEARGGSTEARRRPVLRMLPGIVGGRAG